MNIFKTPELDQIVKDTDNRYSAFGIIDGRRFIADAETLEDVQMYRQELKDEIKSREFARPSCLENVRWLEKQRQKRFLARPNKPYTPPEPPRAA